MNVERLSQLFDYNVWARDILLEQASKLSEAEYVAPGGLNQGSVRATLVHTFAAEQFWLARCAGTAWTQMLTEQDVPTLVDLRSLWLALDANLRTFLTQLTDSDLARIVKYEGARSTRESANPLWSMLFQCFNHNMQHRSEVALILTGFGHSTGDLDWIAWYMTFGGSR